MQPSWKTAVPILLHGFVGWAFCAATMGIGIATVGLATALIVHAIAAPVIFAGVSLVYFRFFGRIGPWATAAAFLGEVIFLDVFVVAMLIQRSFEMFMSLIGTWVPFALIFASTAVTGFIARRISAT